MTRRAPPSRGRASLVPPPQIAESPILLEPRRPSVPPWRLSPPAPAGNESVARPNGNRMRVVEGSRQKPGLPKGSERRVPDRAGKEAPDAGISVLLVNEPDLIRDCLAELLGKGMKDIRVEGVGSMSTLLALPTRTPDVILFSVKATSVAETGIKAELTSLTQTFPDTPIMVMSDQGDLSEALLAIDLGARGYFPDILSVSMLIAALRLVIAGGVFLPTELLLQCVKPAVD